MVELAEHMLAPWTSQDAETSLARAFDEMSGHLIALSPLQREPQLRPILGWLNQVADDRERLEAAKAAGIFSRQDLSRRTSPRLSRQI